MAGPRFAHRFGIGADCHSPAVDGGRGAAGGTQVSGQIADLDGDGDIARELIGISRFNALVMMFAYLAYLVFQLGTHKEEYDDSEEEHERLMHHGGGDGPAVGARRKRKARRNIFCRGMYRRGRSGLFQAISTEEPAYDDDDSETDLEMARRGQRQLVSCPSATSTFLNHPQQMGQYHRHKAARRLRRLYYRVTDQHGLMVRAALVAQLLNANLV